MNDIEYKNAIDGVLLEYDKYVTPLKDETVQEQSKIMKKAKSCPF